MTRISHFKQRQLMKQKQTTWLWLYSFAGAEGHISWPKSGMVMGLVWRKTCPHHRSLQNSYCIAPETGKPLAKKFGWIHRHVWLNCWAMESQNYALYSNGLGHTGIDADIFCLSTCNLAHLKKKKKKIEQCKLSLWYLGNIGINWYFCSEENH